MNGYNSNRVHAIYENFTHENVSLRVPLNTLTNWRRFKIIPRLTHRYSHCISQDTINKEKEDGVHNGPDSGH